MKKRSETPTPRSGVRHPKTKVSSTVAASFANLMRRDGLSLDRLRVLVEVDEAGSLIKAAGGNETRAAQYSHQLSELAGFFEFELTQRDGRAKVVNAEGAALAKLAREFFRGIEDLMQRGRGRERTYRIGAGESLLQWVVVPGLSALSRKVPKLGFRLSNLQNSQIVLGLEDMTLDFGLVRREAVRKPLEVVSLGSLNYVLCVPRPLMRGVERGDWRSVLASLPLAMHLENTYVQGELEAALEGAGIVPNIRLRCDSFPNAMAALRTGAYATLMVRFPGRGPTLEGCEIIELPCLDHTAREIVLAWNPRLPKTRPEAGPLAGALEQHFAWHDR